MKDHTFRKPGHYLLVIGALVMAMEEISWGQRVFHIDTPDFFQRHSTQNELNFHNLVDQGRFYPYLGSIILLGVVVLPIVAHVFQPIKRASEQFGIPLVRITLVQNRL